MTYLMNAWYAAGWSEGFVPGKPVARTLLDQPLVFFRDHQGRPHALLDRCPHRFAPLSMGTQTADGHALQCPYHGLRFDGTGACVHNPHGDGRLPAAATVCTWPLAERHGMVWIWMGNTEHPDEALIPDFSCLDEDDHHVARGYLLAHANYTLEIDNILDLSHIEFLHPGSLGSEAIKAAHTEVRQEGRRVWSLRQTVDERMPDFLYQAFDVPFGQRVDRWLDVRWDAPANLLLLGGTTPTGRPRSEGREGPMAHLFTPQTATTTHYWFAVGLDKQAWPNGQHLVGPIIEGVKAPFTHEDLPMLEAQQRAMGEADFWSLKPVLLGSDAPGVRARRLLDALIKEERQAAAASHA